MDREKTKSDVTKTCLSSDGRYIYSDTVALTEENASAVLEIAHYYQVTNLVQFCADYLATLITPENACALLTLAMFYKVTTLRDACCTVIDRNADEILKSEGFLELSEECLTYILKGDTFYADEDNIFIKAEEWSKRKIEEVCLEKIGPDVRKALGASFFYLRLPTMSFETLTKCTHKKGYFAVEEYEDIVEFINKISPASVKSNSCVARLPTEETMAINDEDGEAKISDNITTKFHIFVSRDVKLTNFVVTDVRKYLKYHKQNYTDENCPSVSITECNANKLFCKYNTKLLKLTYSTDTFYGFEKKSVQELKAAHGEDLSDKLDIVISGSLKVTCPRTTQILGDLSEKAPKLNEEEDTAGNGGALVFQQDFKLQSLDFTQRRINLEEPLILTKAASPYTVEITMNYGCTSGVKMKTRCSKTKSVISKFEQLQIEDIAGHFAGVKSLGFENISKR